MKPEDIDSLEWAKGQGLLPAIVQHADNGTVLMTAYVNREALQLMLERHELVLYSRSRQQLWVKGETSGNRIVVDRVVTGTDADIARAARWLFHEAKQVVEPSGAATVAAVLWPPAGSPLADKSRKVVAVLSGGNVAPETLAALERP